MWRSLGGRYIGRGEGQGGGGMEEKEGRKNGEGREGGWFK